MTYDDKTDLALILTRHGVRFDDLIDDLFKWAMDIEMRAMMEGETARMFAPFEEDFHG